MIHISSSVVHPLKLDLAHTDRPYVHKDFLKNRQAKQIERANVKFDGQLYVVILYANTVY